MSGPAEDVANTIFEGETDVTAPDCPSPTAKGLATWCNSDLWESLDSTYLVGLLVLQITVRRWRKTVRKCMLYWCLHRCCSLTYRNIENIRNCHEAYKPLETLFRTVPLAFQAPLLDQFAAKPAAADPAAPAGQGKGPLRRHDEPRWRIGKRKLSPYFKFAPVCTKLTHGMKMYTYMNNYEYMIIYMYIWHTMVLLYMVLACLMVEHYSHKPICSVSCSSHRGPCAVMLHFRTTRLKVQGTQNMFTNIVSYWPLIYHSCTWFQRCIKGPREEWLPSGLLDLHASCKLHNFRGRTEEAQP